MSSTILYIFSRKINKIIDIINDFVYNKSIGNITSQNSKKRRHFTMENTTRIRTHFIYETDNIPDHRSRRFGCCPCLMAVRECALLQQKSRI